MIKREIDLSSPNTTDLLLELIVSVYDVAGIPSYITPDRSKLVIGDKKVTETKPPIEEKVVTEAVRKGGRPKGS